MGYQYTHLMQPLKVGGITLKNRMAVAPLGGFRVMNDARGAYTLNAEEYFVERARGGFGLLFTGSALVDMEADKPNLLDGQIPATYAPGAWKTAALRITERVHAYGAKIFVQLGFGHGRMRAGQKAPSAIPRYHNPAELTQELTAEEIETKIKYMIKTAALAKSAGFDGVEIHAMHWGYLLDQFAMAISNKRTDQYGGDLEGRMTVARKIVEGIKAECGKDFPVSMRLGMKSYIKGFRQASLTGEEEAGRTLEEAIEIAKLLEKYGYDMLSVNSGIYDSFYYCSAPAYMPKGFNLYLAKQVKEAIHIPVITAGKMDDPDMCEAAVAEGLTDGIALGRAALAEPRYAQLLQMGHAEKIRPCISCSNCMHTNAAKGTPTCALNPAAMKESYYRTPKTTQPKKVAVIGGGIAGMEAARTAAVAGHTVRLYEKTKKLGGYLQEAGVHFFKESIRNLQKWYIRELEALNVEICCGIEVTSDMLKGMNVDVAILAVGSEPMMPKSIKGIDTPKAVSCIDILNGARTPGEKVVIVGGGLVGAEMAYEFGKEGRDVTLVEALDDILANDPTGVPFQTRDMLSELLDRNGVKKMMGHRLEEINDTGAVLLDGEGKKITVAADDVIMAIGFRARPSMAQQLLGAGIETYEILVGNGIGSIATQVGMAYEIARML